ncbi:MAG TPA: serine/threonine-protein kinase, partial [Terriglobales bacterium]|nr:serine/threonine-protein kinase [Terriglobales bacterium]
RPVALKMIKGKQSSTEGGQARFMREARAASRLQHACIVTIYHFGIEGDTEYIVMEFVEGQSLRKLIHEGPLPLGDLYRIAIQVAEGLTAAHEANVVHRDMKGDNIMVTAKGAVKILDFGLAKLKDPVDDSDDTATAFQTQAGLAVGTATHMSPEQAMGRDVDGKSDVFSFGVVLYHMAAGKVPFSGPNAATTMAQILDANPTPVRDINPDVPEELALLISRCLQKNKVHRPPAADALKILRALRDVHTGARAAAGVAASLGMPEGGPGGAASQSPVPGAITAWQTPPQGVLTPGSGYPASAGMRQSSQQHTMAIEEEPPPPPSVFYRPLVVLDSIITWIFVALLLALAVLFVASGLPVLAHDLEQYSLYLQAKALLAPLVDYVHKITEQKESARVWDMTYPGVGIGLLIIRAIILWPIRSAQRALRPMA